MEASNRRFAVLFFAAALSVGSVTQAQANPELGDTGEPTGTWAPPSTGGEATATATADTGGDVGASADTGGDSSDSSPSSSPSGEGAHADVVGKFGIGFFGVIDVPICLGGGGGGCDAVIQNGDPAVVGAPTIGLRYWLNETIGIEAALGIASSSGTQTITPTGGIVDENLDVSTFGLVLHGAVPIALAYSGNFVFQVVPELNFGITSGTIYDNNAGMNAPNDADISGMLIQLGGRAGAEIHFGFIGLPQLSLQGTVGLHLSYTSRTVSDQGGELSHTSTNIGTSVQNDPWDIFTGNVTAIYYFID